MSSRRRVREIAVQALYAMELSGNSLNLVLGQFLGAFDKNNPMFQFASDLISKTYNARQELDAYIRKRSNNWDFERIAIIDKIVMRMAICEFLHFFDIPPKVSIDEAIELSKMYSTEKSSSFINGILDAVLDDLKKSQQLVKVGRGRK
ncbi:transcription antitermination factor NusB [candidate division KSB1 bacterium]|nr:transcription antitermination factor NusB [candidate division KSB1 bacterium]